MDVKEQIQKSKGEKIYDKYEKIDEKYVMPTKVIKEMELDKSKKKISKYWIKFRHR